MNFTAAGEVDSRNSMAVQKYSYLDSKIPEGIKTVYYRIRIIELDQSYKLSKVVMIKIAVMSKNEMVITPNPANYDAQVKFNTAKGGNATITIYDAEGKLVSRQTANVPAGNNSISIDIAKLKEGVFVVKITTGSENYSSKLMIWK
jgi:hypothetical protein